MKIKLIDKTKDKVVFKVSGINYQFANSLRRAAMNEVPVLAVEDVEFNKNDSALYDEIIAHRLGLIPIKTDLRSYNLRDECTCKKKGCAKCQLKLTLNVKRKGDVLASDLKSKDPKCAPVYPNMPITRLTKNQVIELEAIAVLGKGKEHAKFSPGLVFYRNEPVLIADKSSDSEKCLKECPRGAVEKKGDKLEINHAKWNEACEQICEKNGFKVDYLKNDFIFVVESWGQLEPKEIMIEAAKALQDKSGQFIKAIEIH